MLEEHGTDEMTEDEDEEELSDVIDETWSPASYNDVIECRPLKEPRKVKIVINREKKRFAELSLRDLTVDQQLAIEETFISLQPGKKGEKSSKSIKIDLQAYYQLCYEYTVVEANPPHLKKWKNIKKLGRRSGVWAQIKAILPDPYKDDTNTNMTEKEVKN